MFAITAQFPRTPARAFFQIEGEFETPKRLSPDDLSSLPRVSLARVGVRGNLVDTVGKVSNGEWEDGRWPTCFAGRPGARAPIFTVWSGWVRASVPLERVANDAMLVTR